MLFISSLPAEIFAEILNEHSTSDLWAWRNSILGLELVWASSRADGSHCTFTESCFFKCLVMPWELWPPGQTGSIPSEGTGMFFFFFFNQCFIHDKEEICVSLEKTECLNEINLTTLLLKLWVFVLGERYEDPHLGLCELSKWGARAQRKQCRPSKQWTLQIIVLLLYLAFLRRRRITAFSYKIIILLYDRKYRS